MPDLRVSILHCTQIPVPRCIVNCLMMFLVHKALTCHNDSKQPVPATSLSLLLQHHYCIQLTVLRSLVSTAPAAFSATLMPLLLHSHQRSSTLLLTFVKLFCQTSLNHCFPAVKFLQTVLFELPRVFFSQQCLATLF